MPDLSGKKIAVLMTNGFEEIEYTEPRKALEEAGATVEIVSPAGGQVRAWDGGDWGNTYRVDVPVAEADPSAYDGLLLPGGVMNPDKLRMERDALRFTRAFFEQGKPVAAICHGPWTLIDAGVIEGRTVTAYPSLRSDLTNAGAEFVDREVVVDQGLVTSRRPDDLPAFNRKMVEEFAEGKHEGQRTEAARGD